MSLMEFRRIVGVQKDIFFFSSTSWRMPGVFSALLALFIGLSTLNAIAEPARPIGDPAIETRLKAITEELRCLTCMGQSIADSNSGFSDDMRREIRRLIADGKSDRQIIDFMVQRYGDFVLYRPPVKRSTWLLWLGPFALLGIALAALFFALKRRARDIAADTISAEDHAEAARLLGQTKEIDR